MPQRARRAALTGLDHPNATRLHDLLAALQAGDTLNADQAAEAFGVSRRTIARDLKFLREDLELDVIYDQPSRSYRLKNEQHTPGDGRPTHSALAAFLVARHALAALGGTTDHGLLEAVTERLVEALPPTLRIEDPAAISTPDQPAALGFAHIVTLHRAIEHRHRVALHLADRNAAAPDPFVPRALLSRQSRWWAVAEASDQAETSGQAEDSGAPARFRFVPLGGLRAVHDLGPDHSEAPDLDLDALLAAHPIICDQAGHRIFHASLSPAAVARSQTPTPPFQHRLLEHERGADLYLCAASAAEAARWCLWIGDGVQTRQPELRAAIVRVADEIATRHR